MWWRSAHYCQPDVTMVYLVESNSEKLLRNTPDSPIHPTGNRRQVFRYTASSTSRTLGPDDVQEQHHPVNRKQFCVILSGWPLRSSFCLMRLSPFTVEFTCQRNGEGPWNLATILNILPLQFLKLLKHYRITVFVELQ